MDGKTAGRGREDTITLPERKPQTLILFALVFLVVLFLRLPFLGNGFGRDGDAWRVALVAEGIARGAGYEASRLPGYPVHEFVCALLIGYGWVATNFATALMGAVSAAFLALVLLRLGTFPALAAAGGIAYACAPGPFVNGVSTVDYPFAMAFLLAAVYFALGGRAVFSGVLLGFAIGTRLPSLMFLPVLWLVLVHSEGRFRFASLFACTTAALITAAVLWIPVFARYGISFLTFYQVGYPPLSDVLYKMTIDTWGRLGLVALALGFGAWAYHRMEGSRMPSAAARFSPPLATAFLLGIILPTAQFLKLPMEAGYLMPAVAFTVLVSAAQLTRKVFAALSVLLALSGLVTFGPSGFGRGVVFLDYEFRGKELAFARSVLESASQNPNGAAIVAGEWEPQLLWLKRHYLPEQASVEILYLASPRDANRIFRNPGTVYLLPHVQDFNQQVHGVDLESRGAQSLQFTE